MKWWERVLGVVVILSMTLVVAGCNGTVGVGVGVAYPGAYGGGSWGVGGGFVGGPVYGVGGPGPPIPD